MNLRGSYNKGLHPETCFVLWSDHTFISSTLFFLPRPGPIQLIGRSRAFVITLITSLKHSFKKGTSVLLAGLRGRTVLHLRQAEGSVIRAPSEAFWPFWAVAENGIGGRGFQFLPSKVLKSFLFQSRLGGCRERVSHPRAHSRTH